MRFPLRSALALLAAAAFAACSEVPTQPSLIALGGGLSSISAPPVVISQVYGGGGNSGATLKNDFIELFNPGSSDATVSGWSVQYASAAGTTWQVTNLSGTIPAGGYYLIQESQGAGGTTSLPTPDASATIAMSATAGKVVLVSATAASSGACPTANVVDEVSFGTTASNCGAGTTATLANTTAAIRNSGGCAYTGSLSADFTAAAPAPRNSASPANSCGGGSPPPPVVTTVTVTPTPATVAQGAQITFTGHAFDQSSQPISGVTFTWSSDNTAVATVTAAGVATAVAQGDAHIIATAPNAVAGQAALHVGPAVTLPDIRFSEIHYDNTGTDVNEAIEIEGSAGTDLTGWTIVLYDGNGGSSYNTTTLSGTIPATCGARGVVVTNYPTNGIQNGSPDGMALVDGGGNVIEFLSYEGTFTAINGPAAGLTSVDIVASESSAPVGISIQRDAFNNWALGQNTFGACNATGSPPPTGTTVSVTMNLPRQAPQGFVKPAFATVKDANGNTITPALTWTSSDPTIATVDGNGYVTAVAASGTVHIRATEPGGAFGETTFDALPTTVPTGAVYHTHTMFGVPADADPSDDILITRPQYALSYNAARGGPNWVAFDINATTFGASPRCDCFSPDPQLPGNVTHVVDFNYRNGGYDRGHMTQSEVRTDTYQENATTFYLTNVLPQAAENNQGPWSKLENDLNDMVRLSGKEVWVYAGGVYAPNPGSLKNEGVVQIPDYTWKVAVILNAGQTLADVHSIQDLQVIAVQMPNLTTSGGPNSAVGIRNVPWQNFQTTVDAIEAEIGYDLLSALPDNIENPVEANDHPPVAVSGGPYSGAEGSPVAFNASASSDPDAGDVLTYAWDFGDGQTGTGATPSHTYGQPGTYTVSLTVTDKYGLTDAQTTTATIANVPPVIAPFAGASLITGETYSTSGSFADPGTDTWTATVDYGDGSGTQPLSLAGKSFSLSHTYTAPGSFTVTVTVSDGIDVASASASVTVLTPSQAVQVIADQVAGTNSLKSKLDAAINQLDRGNTTPALGQLNAFLNEADAMVKTGRMSQAMGDSLRAQVNRVIQDLTQTA